MGNRYGLSPLTETAPDLRGGKDKLRNGVRDAVGIENEVKVWDKVRIRKILPLLKVRWFPTLFLNEFHPICHQFRIAFTDAAAHH